jgi:hypothetical protein
MKLQKAKIPEQIAKSNYRMLGAKDIMILLDCGEDKAYNEINLIRDCKKDEFPNLYNPKNKSRKKVLISHFIETNDFELSNKEISYLLENGISIEEYAINNLDSE